MLLCPLIRRPDAARFQVDLQRLHRAFGVYAATSPQPLPAPGLAISPEIRLQSELYLPIDNLRRLFYRLYRHVLSHTPIFASSPFHASLSWADCYAGLPAWLQFSANPAVLLERLLDDYELLVRFVFHSFLPSRFNGAGFGRYRAQLGWLRQRLVAQSGPVRVLDAACGSGEGSWELLELLAITGRLPEQAQVEGWTLEPLEVWAAQTCCLPHDPLREQSYQARVQPLLAQGWEARIRFQAVDLLGNLSSGQRFDLILCNGLLGGPLVHQLSEMRRISVLLDELLQPGGILLAANQFHEGWKKQVPESILAELFRDQGLQVEQAGEGVAGIKPCT